ncbi:MAG: Membrane protein involved in the export of O-antigen and teichoic acid [Acidobacteriaceae bacterium]|nr:Membrane protein involved in the export of O-antigen and teichoic acid [Acidobacteriaceae bacterium]
MQPNSSSTSLEIEPVRAGPVSGAASPLPGQASATVGSVESHHSRKAPLANAVYGVLDYVAYPVGMLLLAPVVLRNLGVQQYGIWTVATAAVSAGSIIASGFGDANIQYVATQRSTGDPDAVVRTVRSTMGIHLIMGAAIALLGWALAPYVAVHVASTFALRRVCLWSLRIASLLMLVRTVESVCISTQRAFERYGAAVRVSILARLLTLVAAAALTFAEVNVAGIMVATAILLVIGVWIQLIHLKRLLRVDSLIPAFDRSATKALFAFGIFSWVQAVSGVVFSQSDRLITGVSLGATAVASYALCVQMAQPIYGLAASGLHFLFPYLSGQRVTASAPAFRKAVILAFAANLLLVATGLVILLLFGNRVLYVWGGAAIAQSARPVLPMIAWGSALLGLNVTGYYAMLALGRVKTVTWLSLGGGALMMLLMAWLLPHYGIRGVAVARLFYGPITLLLYLPLALLLRVGPDTRLRMTKGELRNT